MHYELKHDQLKKCRLVAGGNRLDTSIHNTSSSMFKNSSIRLLLLVATARRLQVAGGSLENAYLNALCGEKVWTVSGTEFGEKEGINILIKIFNVV